MLKHYFKVAFRNLWKYKSQTLISVVGLAVGFTCFALATLWIRYETTFDNFHKNADRIYRINLVDIHSPSGNSKSAPHPLAAYLKNTFPEIAVAAAVLTYRSKIDIQIDDITHNINLLRVDSSFLKIFDIKILEGNSDFLIPDSRNLAITQAKARQLFGDENPVGKVTSNNSTICAVVTGFPKNSNYSFDFLSPHKSDLFSWYMYFMDILIELNPFIDVKTFEKKLKKLKEHEYPIEMSTQIANIISLADIHYKDPNMERNVQFKHIVIFALAGSLVILCTLFNYLTLFISRFRIRQKELALRTVYGASGRSLFMLLSVEFVMTLILSLLLCLFFVHTLFSGFRTLSGITSDLSSAYPELLAYTGVIVLVSLITFLLVLAIFRRKTLNASIGTSNKKLFRKISIIAQLIISIGFSFCTIVVTKQMYYLHNTDLGFAFKNRASIEIHNDDIDINVLLDYIKQFPEISETIVEIQPLIPYNGGLSQTISNSGENPFNITFESVEIISDKFLQFYEIQLVEGEFLNDNDSEDMILINESAVKILGWDEIIGKQVGGAVKGIVKNTYNFSPTVSAKPTMYKFAENDIYNMRKASTILFKYAGETWKTCKNKIESFIKENYPAVRYTLSNAEEEYDKFLKSENTLLKLLTILSLVCVIICVFGFVSLVSLTCEERRKEIAIRKINGATIKDILDIFFKEYITLLVISAVIAFPLGYYIMRRWLEDYVVQTPIDAWIYAVILLALIMSIVLCVGWKVYKTSRENPAEVVKS